MRLSAYIAGQSGKDKLSVYLQNARMERENSKEGISLWKQLSNERILTYVCVCVCKYNKGPSCISFRGRSWNVQPSFEMLFAVETVWIETEKQWREYKMNKLNSWFLKRGFSSTQWDSVGYSDGKTTLAFHLTGPNSWDRFRTKNIWSPSGVFEHKTIRHWTT